MVYMLGLDSLVFQIYTGTDHMGFFFLGID